MCKVIERLALVRPRTARHDRESSARAVRARRARLEVGSGTEEFRCRHLSSVFNGFPAFPSRDDPTYLESFSSSSFCCFLAMIAKCWRASRVVR